MLAESARAPASAQRAHIPALDGLRGIAVLTVMILHFSMLVPAGPFEHAYLSIARNGWAGVDLFFVLSGFLITGILCDARGAPFYFRSFYIRRTLRIFPLYYAFLFALFVLLPMVMPSHAEPGLDGTRALLWGYLGNFAFAAGGWEGMPAHTTHLWSLAVEEQFYLLWPLVVWWATPKQLTRVCLVTIAVAWLARAVFFVMSPDGIAGYALLPARMDALAAGALVAVLMRQGHGENMLRHSRTAMAGACVVLGLVALWRWVTSGDPTLSALDVRVQLFAYPAFALLFGAVIVQAVHASREGRLHRVLTAPSLLMLGRYSYALYLVHIPLRDFMRHRFVASAGLPRILGSQMPAQLALLVLGMTVSLAVAIVSWHAFEKHLLALKRFFPYGAPAQVRVPQHAPDRAA